MDSPDSKETWDLKEIGVSSVWSDPVVRMVLKVLRVVLVLLVNQDRWVWLERRVNWAFLDCLDTQDDRGRRVRPVSPDSQEPTERKEAGVLRENPVQGGREVRRGHVGLGVPGVLLESQVLRAHRAMMVHLARPEREDLKDPRDPLASQDRRAPLDHLERMGCPVTLASGGRRVSKVKLVPLVPEVWSALRVQPEKQVL